MVETARAGGPEWGIDLVGRTMWYEPWPVDPAGHYRQPTATELEETYGGCGEAVRETLEYFEACGGDSAALVTLLNDHVPDARFRADRETLLDASRWYTNEYYFYFQMFCKKVIGRYDWHFGEGSSNLLSKWHQLWESGRMKHDPWGADIHDQSVQNNLVLLIYIEEQLKMDTEELLFWINSSATYDAFTFTREHYNRQGLWLNCECVMYFYGFSRIFTNMNNVLFLAGKYGTEKRVLNARLLITIVPKKFFGVVFLNATKSANNIYKYQFTNEAGSFSVTAENMNERISAMFGKYLVGSVYSNAQMSLGAFRAFPLFALNAEEPVKEAFQILETDHKVKYVLKYTWNKFSPRIWFRFFFWTFILSIGIAMLHAIGKLQESISDPFFWIGACAPYLCIYLLNRVGQLKQTLLINTEAAHEQLEDLEKTSLELFREKSGLEKNIAIRTAELAAANERLTELDRAKTQFFSNISHELRTPLTLILGPLESFRDGAYGEAITRESREVRSMHQNALRLMRLINQLLDFSRIEAGRLVCRRRALVLNRALGFWASTVHSGAESRKLSLEFCDESSAKIIAAVDHDLFEKAVYNLLSNAFKFTPEGGRITVTLEGPFDGDEGKTAFAVSVADTGIGVPPDKQQAIFERFSQVDGSASRKYEGTGIGLAFTREIVELHGGRIELESTPGAGSTFRLVLPVGEVDADAEVEEIGEAKASLLVDFHGEGRAATPGGASADGEPVPVVPALPAAVGKADGGKARLLVVDDNADMRAFLEGLLAPYYDIVSAADGAAGLEAVRRDRPDLVISDMMMPVMNGYELLAAIRADGSTASLPVILLTAKADVEMRLEGLAAGADDYIAKPFNARELFVRVANLLHGRELRAELARKQRETDLDFEQAAKVQERILTPRTVWEAIPGFAVQVLWRPMNGAISGDYYNIQPRGTGMGVFIADAPGHGVQAALSTMQLDLLNRETEGAKYPDARLEAINGQLFSRFDGKSYFTAFLAHFEPDRVRYSCAGHPGQFLVRRGTVSELRVKGRVLGLLPETDFSLGEAALEPGDLIVFFTDGASEAFNPSGEEFGEERLAACLAGLPAGATPAAAGEAVLAALAAFTGRATLDDDLTMVLVKRT